MALCQCWKIHVNIAAAPRFLHMKFRRFLSTLPYTQSGGLSNIQQKQLNFSNNLTMTCAKRTVLHCFGQRRGLQVAWNLRRPPMGLFNYLEYLKILVGGVSRDVLFCFVLHLSPPPKKKFHLFPPQKNKTKQIRGFILYANEEGKLLRSCRMLWNLVKGMSECLSQQR